MGLVEAVSSFLDRLTGGPLRSEAEDRLGELRHRQQVVEAKAYLRGWITERDLRDAIGNGDGPPRDAD